MASAPVIETILEQLATDLGAMATPTYSQDLAGRVYRRWPNQALRTDKRAAIFLVTWREQSFLAGTEGASIDVAFGHQGKLLTLRVCFLAPCAKTDREAVGRRFYSDIESILVRESILAGTTVRVNPHVLDLYVEDIYEEDAGGEADFQVWYTTQLGDPRTGASG